MDRAEDGNERARLKEERDRELGLMKAAEVTFDGRHTGYETSIVSSEFGVGTDESMYVYKEGAETHYFFMHEGKLWKYGRTFLDGPTFDARVALYQAKLGAPAAKSDESDGEGGRRLLTALWKQGVYDIHVVNRRTVYGTDILIIENRDVAGRLTSKRQTAAQKAGLGGVDKSVESFLLEDPDTYGAPPPTPSDAPPLKKPPKKTPKNSN
jgi:hypothetical protein